MTAHPLDCPHCETRLAKARQDRLAIPTSCLVIHKSGALAVNCPKCKGEVILPATLGDGPFKLVKGGVPPKYVFRVS